jgi:hypothetical protein
MSKWGRFFDILQVVAPAVLNVIPTTRPLAGVILHAMATAAQLPASTSGAARKTLAMEIVADTVDTTNRAANREVLNKAAALVAADHGIETVYGTAKLIHDAHGQAATLPIPTGSLG